jgi:hypothetical protein
MVTVSQAQARVVLVAQAITVLAVPAVRVQAVLVMAAPELLMRSGLVVVAAHKTGTAAPGRFQAAVAVTLKTGPAVLAVLVRSRSLISRSRRSSPRTSEHIYDIRRASCLT